MSIRKYYTAQLSFQFVSIRFISFYIFRWKITNASIWLMINRFFFGLTIEFYARAFQWMMTFDDNACLQISIAIRSNQNRFLLLCFVWENAQFCCSSQLDGIENSSIKKKIPRRHCDIWWLPKLALDTKKILSNFFTLFVLFHFIFFFAPEFRFN